jgi:D-beta-D-heptose 7-phosphate kinase/D-beta-D-heptose 1-phosphate adenosyltransferase
MRARDKIKSADAMREFCSAGRGEGRRVVFTNGCFDLLHVGHLRYLEAARALGGLLVVGVNSDHSVRRIKGPARPVVSEADRAEIIAGLQCVDGVTIFDEPDPLNLIRLIEPDILVKGADWSPDRIIGSDFVLERGGEVARIPLAPGVSTTAIIERIVAGFKERPDWAN